MCSSSQGTLRFSRFESAGLRRDTPSAPSAPRLAAYLLSMFCRTNWTRSYKIVTWCLIMSMLPPPPPRQNNVSVLQDIHSFWTEEFLLNST